MGFRDFAGLSFLALIAACGGSPDEGGTGGGSSSATSTSSGGGTTTDSSLETGSGSSVGESASSAGTSTGSSSGSTGMETGGSSTTSDVEGGAECGAVTCQLDEICVLPCCGGAGDVCADVPPRGCGEGYEEVPNDECSLGECAGETCCLGPCIPPPAFCAPIRELDAHCQEDLDPSDGACEQICA